MQRYERSSRVFASGAFELEARVHDLLERHDSKRDAILEELEGCEALVRAKMRNVIQRQFTKFIVYANRIEDSAQNLLKVKEEVSALKSTLDQIAHLPLEVDDEAEVSPPGPIFDDTPQDDQTPYDALKEEIDLAIFEHDFEKATATLQQPSTLNPLDHLKLEEYVVQQILSALKDTPGSSKSLLRLLIALDRPQTAYDFFFSKRSQWVRSEIRRVRFSVDLVVYVKDISAAVFRGLAATYTEFIQMEGTDATKHKSTAIRWLHNELNDFCEFSDSQIRGTRDFCEAYKSIAEVFKASRDHLEPLALDLCPHLHSGNLQATARDLFDIFTEEFSLDMPQLLNDDTFTPNPGESFYIDEVHAPPLWTRAARDKTSALISTSTQALLHGIASILGPVRAVCLNNTEALYPARAGDRPWPIIEEIMDTYLSDFFKTYIMTAFNRGKSGLPLPAFMMLYSNLQFIIQQLLPRVSEVLRQTFHRERITNIDMVIEKKCVAVCDRLLDAVGGEWTKVNVVAPYLKWVKEAPPKAVITEETKSVVQGLARVKIEATEVLLSGEDAIDVVKGYVRAVMSSVCSVKWWLKIFSSIEEEPLRKLGKNPRRAVIVNVNALMHAFGKYAEEHHWEKLVEVLEITPSEVEKANTVFLQDKDKTDVLTTAMEELNDESEAAGIVAT